jgi:hypothetical protein
MTYDEILLACRERLKEIDAERTLLLRVLPEEARRSTVTDVATSNDAPKRKRRRALSAATRKKMSLAAKKRWANSH